MSGPQPGEGETRPSLITTMTDRAREAKTSPCNVIVIIKTSKRSLVVMPIKSSSFLLEVGSFRGSSKYFTDVSDGTMHSVMLSGFCTWEGKLKASKILEGRGGQGYCAASSFKWDFQEGRANWIKFHPPCPPERKPASTLDP